MTSFEAGEIVLIAFPQIGTSAKKKRPALVALDIGDDDLVLAPVTTRNRSGAGDVQIHQWSKAGLLRPSWVRLAKVACLEKQAVTKRLGRLAARELGDLAERWRRLYRFE
jgi:mRNA interferase MazF